MQLCNLRDCSFLNLKFTTQKNKQHINNNSNNNNINNNRNDSSVFNKYFNETVLFRLLFFGVFIIINGKSSIKFAVFEKAKHPVTILAN